MKPAWLSFSAMVSVYHPPDSAFLVSTRQQGTKQRRSSQAYIEAIARQFSLIYLLPNFQCGRQSEKGMKRLITAVGLASGFVSLFACQQLTSEHSTLARVTVYWRGEGSGGEHASSNGGRLRESHCAVDPKKFIMVAKLSFLMRPVWPSTADRPLSIARRHGRAGETQLNATRL